MTSVTSHAHTNGIAPVVRKPVQVKFLISDDSPGQYINIHLTIQSHALILFVTSTDSFGGADVSANDQAADATGGRLASLGSFVFAMPNRHDPAEALSTSLYHETASIDFATRLAKVLARKTGKGIYVGNSASFVGTVNGGTVEEEVNAFRNVVHLVMDRL